jgi:hypothetical protein
MLSSLTPGDWDQEIRGSKLALEAVLGHNVCDFAWPYGMRRHFSEPLRRYCSDIGFKTIANAIPGCQKIVERDPLNIHRSDWHFGVSLENNIAHLCVDARLFAWITGRSVLGRPRRNTKI